MRSFKLRLEPAIVFEPVVHRDERGYFKETFSRPRYREAGIAGDFVQDNVSVSRKGVLRGLHYDFRMAKLVQCLDGEIFDVIVDVREDSPTYRQWESVVLSGENHRQLYVPQGFAHGFYVLSETAIVHYKQTALFDPKHERSLRWDDPAIGIEWPLAATPLLSAKDAAC